MQRPLLIQAGWVLLAMSVSVHAATYYVAQRSTQADDSGPGTEERPWKTIGKGAETARPGDAVLVLDGVYREGIVEKTSGTATGAIRFEAAPEAHVILTGADHLTGWQKVEGTRPLYRVPWPHRFNAWSKNMTHPDDAYYRLIGRCEQVAVEGYLLRQVLDPAALAPGAFFADVTNQMVMVWDFANRDLNKVSVEASVRQEILRVDGDFVELRGFHFRFAANAAQHGAVVLAGNHDVMEDCVLDEMNASGATFTGQNMTVRRCVFRDNGQIGFGANGAHYLLFTKCLVENNNTKGFDRGWEAGGNKLVLTREAVLERSRFVQNRGNGIWFDIGNQDCTVRQCLIADNEDSGIFDEISFGLRAQDNVITGNGFAETPGAWGAQAGISLSSSPGSVIEHNVIVGNREGFDFREQTRTTPTIGDRAERPVWNHDEIIRHNIIAFNRDAQIWGWFDTRDNRQWPAGETSGTSRSAGEKNQARDLSLEKLNLRFERNTYFFRPDEGAFKWGVPWGRHASYETLPQFQSALGIDAGSRVLDPGFANIAGRDFRMNQQAMENAPRGPVPGVILGLQDRR